MTARKLCEFLDDMNDDEEIKIVLNYGCGWSDYGVYDIVDFPKITHGSDGRRLPESEQFSALEINSGSGKLMRAAEDITE